jgi:hypothetical protein
MIQCVLAVFCSYVLGSLFAVSFSTGCIECYACTTSKYREAEQHQIVHRNTCRVYAYVDSIVVVQERNSAVVRCTDSLSAMHMQCSVACMCYVLLCIVC